MNIETGSLFPKASDALGDFIRRSRRSAKIARYARCSDCDFRRSPRSAYKIADIWHVRYRRLNSLAFAKCARSRDFLRLLLRIASKANPSGWAILSHEFSKLPHRLDRRKKSPGVSASIGGEVPGVAGFKPATHRRFYTPIAVNLIASENRKRFSPPIDADTPGDFFRRSRRCGSFENSCDKSPNLKGWLYWRFAAINVENRGNRHT